MKLEDQVASLELCKRLKELGVKQESFIVWIHAPFKGQKVWTLALSAEAEKDQSIEIVSAFTTSELGEMLYRVENGFRVDTMNWNDRIRVFLNHYAEPGHEELADTEADARAKMLIYLIENKLVKP